MKKIKLLLEYDGTEYHGWQIQKNGLTIQGIIEDRLKKITGAKTKLIAASRTDAGAHALGQVVTFFTESCLDNEKIKKAINALLPKDIRVIDASEVNSTFHPRFDAKKKTYFYIISNQREISAFLYRYSWLVPHPLKIVYIRKASKVLIGKHDFSSFKGSGSNTKNNIREIFSISIKKLEEIEFMSVSIKGNFIKISIEADGFLRHMARNIVGTLVEIGKGRISVLDMEKILKSCDRRLAGPTAPANGLFLERIIY
ncbi:MAG: tRNA pseudouridine(38-40) synthase TruA [Nitrospirae bacterium]|nr:tRNA pseudouridine(38-40) synthase TruA [Nitrospirota bacterium]